VRNKLIHVWLLILLPNVSFWAQNRQPRRRGIDKERYRKQTATAWDACPVYVQRMSTASVWLTDDAGLREWWRQLGVYSVWWWCIPAAEAALRLLDLLKRICFQFPHSSYAALVCDGQGSPRSRDFGVVRPGGVMNQPVRFTHEWHNFPNATIYRKATIRPNGPETSTVFSMWQSPTATSESMPRNNENMRLLFEAWPLLNRV